MALSDRQIRRQTEERTVKITEVNMATGHISMSDQYGTQLRASLDFSAPLVSIPNVGDTWIAQRKSASWYLIKQQTVNALLDLAPGDRSLSAPADLKFSGLKVIINGIDLNNLAARNFTPTWSASPVTNGNTAWAELVVPGVAIGGNVVVNGGNTARSVFLHGTVYQTNGVRVSLRNDSGGSITPPATLYLTYIG